MTRDEARALFTDEERGRSVADLIDEGRIRLLTRDALAVEVGVDVAELAGVGLAAVDGTLVVVVTATE
jgi:hypothetical protein